MREILFRGKRTDGKGWIYGYYSFNTTTNIHWIRMPRTIYWDEDMVIPETVGQYTGLCDKNGKKIFEGDILEYEEEYYLVKFLEYRWVAIYKTCMPDDLDQIGANDFKIAGNIYDNPELLEE